MFSEREFLAYWELDRKTQHTIRRLRLSLGATISIAVIFLVTLLAYNEDNQALRRKLAEPVACACSCGVCVHRP